MIGNGRMSPCFGEMYIKSPGITFDFTAPADIFHQVGGFEKGGERNIVIDETGGEFEIYQDGNYKFDGVASLYPSAGMKINFAAFVNGVKDEKVETSIDFKNNQDTNTFSGTGILCNLKKGDKVSVRGKSDTVSVTLTIEYMNIHLMILN